MELGLRDPGAGLAPRLQREAAPLPSSDLVDVPRPEGAVQEVSVTILDVPSPADRDAFRRSAGSWKDTVDAETLIKNIYESRLVSTRPVPQL